MTTKLRSLGEPRLGIAQIWSVPTTLDGKLRVMASVTDEELEHFRQVTGVDAEELTSRLQNIAANYQRDQRRCEPRSCAIQQSLKHSFFRLPMPALAADLRHKA